MPAFITLKDHKPNFNTNPKCRLINPSKSELGKISKFLIEKVNTIIRDKSLVNQWRDIDTVINWFKNIDNKNNCIFMQFDIEESYPSVSKALLMKAIDHAQSFVTINKEEVKTIMHSRESLLFNNTSVWIKREGDPDFDVTMGRFDGAEICELVGVYIHNVLGEKYGKERVGLYRDNGLAYFENISGPQAEKIRKNVIRIFKQEFDLNITSETNLKIVNFLDVTLNPFNGKISTL